MVAGGRRLTYSELDQRADRSPTTCRRRRRAR